MMRKYLLIATAFVLMNGSVWAEGSDLSVIASGNDCGNNCSWSLDNAGNLSITGSGNMANFKEGEAPWQEQMADIKNVNMDNRLTSVGGYAFDGATNLISANIPTSAEKIGESAFANSGLKSVDIPSSVASIGYRAFQSAESLETVNIAQESALTDIYTSAFSGASSLKSINLPSTVTSISNYAFKGTALSNINLPSSLTYIGAYAFQGSGLESLDIPNSVTSMGYGAFMNATSLKSVHIAEDSALTTIGKYVFSGATGLESVNLPKSLTSIGEYAFGNTGLKSIEIPENVVSLGNGVFYSTDNLENVKFSASGNLKTIDAYAFLESGIEHIDLPDGIETIGSLAFDGSKLIGDLVIPDSVKSVEGGILVYNEGVTGLIFSENSQLESLADDTFYDGVALERIILPPNFQFEPNTVLDLRYTGKLQNLYLTPEQAQNVSFTGKSSNFAPLVYQMGEGGIMVSKNGREIYKYDSLTKMLDGTDWLERYEYSEDKKYGGLRQEAFAKDGDGEKYLGAEIYRPDGSIVLVDENNKFINKLHAKIYTVEEAMAVTRDGNVNRVRLTYK